MKGKFEVMAPAGNFESLSAAINSGADSVYFGVGNLNMRARSANNFVKEDIPDIVSLCRKHGLKTYLTVNIVFYDSELEEMHKTVSFAMKSGIDAIIASDMAAVTYARAIGMEVHISTQSNVSNFESLRFYSQFADVVVLARELNLMQVKRISQSIKDNGIKGPHGNEIRLEMFCHGALCMSISGKCYLSLDEYNSSANRGGCYQLCRRGYEVTDLETGRKLNIDNKYIMSPKDLCTIEFVDKMANAGVSVFKIEGRARSAEYVGIVTRAYREALDAVEKGIFDNDLGARLKARLSEVFNRGFWDGYYMGARLGEWSSVYGNKATRKKTYCGRVTNYFTKIKVAEILIEAAELSKGMHILIIGPSTGAIEADVSEIRVDLKPSGIAQKGEYCSIPVEAKLRRSDKVYIFE